jgi:hypothetical protein
MTRAVTGAQYASGKRASRAAATETTAPTGVRKAWTAIGQSSQPERRFASRLRLGFNMRPLQLFVAVLSLTSVSGERMECGSVNAESRLMPSYWMRTKQGWTQENTDFLSGNGANRASGKCYDTVEIEVSSKGVTHAGLTAQFTSL